MHGYKLSSSNKERMLKVSNGLMLEGRMETVGKHIVLSWHYPGRFKGFGENGG